MVKSAAAKQSKPKKKSTAKKSTAEKSSAGGPLTKLLAFEAKHPGIYYASGFELQKPSPGDLASWSTDPAFTAPLTVFAQANGSGSMYALWQPDASTTPDKTPVLVFGDEGGVHLVAENVATLLRMLAYDCEPMVDHDGVTFYRDKDDPQSAAHEPYVKWLTKEIGAPIAKSKDISAALKAAKTAHGKAFKAFAKKYIPQ